VNGRRKRSILRELVGDLCDGGTAKDYNKPFNFKNRDIKYPTHASMTTKSIKAKCYTT